MNISLAAQTKQLMNKYNLRPKKRLGQNFLINERIMEGIVAAAELELTDTVVEIGPGTGNLTLPLAQKAKQLLAIEIDGQLVPALRERLASYPNFKLLYQDVLKVNLDQAVREAFPEASYPYKVVANLPYYITTPIIMDLLEQRYKIKTMILMVQKEVGERIKACPGTKEYGALSVAVQYYAEPELVMKVPPSSFKPAPEVDSVVIRLRVREVPTVVPLDEKLFFRVVRAAFGQRRKTLTNALVSAFTELPKSDLINILEKIGIDPRIRGEQLGLADFAAIADALFEF